jgi:hypothetical protein
VRRRSIRTIELATTEEEEVAELATERKKKRQHGTTIKWRCARFDGGVPRFDG